jgi:hypothetical protein
MSGIEPYLNYFSGLRLCWRPFPLVGGMLRRLDQQGISAFHHHEFYRLSAVTSGSALTVPGNIGFPGPVRDMKK